MTQRNKARPAMRGRRKGACAVEALTPLAVLLVTARAAKQMTAEELAEKLGVSTATIANAEIARYPHGAREQRQTYLLSEDVLLSAARVLGVEASTLLRARALSRRAIPLPNLSRHHAALAVALEESWSRLGERDVDRLLRLLAELTAGEG